MMRRSAERGEICGLGLERELVELLTHSLPGNVRTIIAIYTYISADYTCLGMSVIALIAHYSRRYP